MDKAKQNNNNLMLRIAVILLCIVLVTSWFASNIMAKYADNTSVDSDAYVASFKVSATEDFSKNLPLTLNPEDTTPNKYAIKITNDSEVCVVATVSLQLRGNLPLAVNCPPTDDDGNATQLCPNTLLVDEQDPITVSWSYTIGVDEDLSDYIYIGWAKDYESYRYENGVESAKLSITVEQAD